MVKMVYGDLNLRELRVLGVLLQERSITKTALVLETTQPAISKTLKHLRNEFSDPVWSRPTRMAKKLNL